MITDIEVTATERIGKLFCKLLAEVDIDIAEIPLAGDLRVEAVGHDHLHACLAWHI